MTESNVPTIDYEQAEGDPQTRKIADFFFKSFPVSQGSPFLQKRFMEYAHLVHPEWKITEVNRQKIKSQVDKRVMSFLRHSESLDGQETPGLILHPNIESAEKKASEVSNRLEDLENILNTELNIDRKYLIGDIALETIRKDFRHLYNERTGEPKSRTRSSANELVTDPTDSRYRALLDPYLSYICYFSLTSQRGEGPVHSLGNETIDQAFAEIRDYVRNGDLTNLDRDDDAKFDIVINYYNKTHPQNPARA